MTDDVSSNHKQRLADLIQESVQEIANKSADRVIKEVASYRDNPAPSLRAEVSAHCRAVFEIFIENLRSSVTPDTADYSVTSMYAMNRVAQSIPLADFLRAFRISQITLWESVQAIADTEPALKDASAKAVVGMLQVLETGATTAATAYAEAERYIIADATRATRDVVEALLGGNPPTRGPHLAALHTAGLSSGSPFVVMSGLALATPSAPRDLTQALGRLSSANRGLLTMRQDEIIGILPVSGPNIDSMEGTMQRMVTVLRERGIALTAGLSMVNSKLEAAPEAYREAQVARVARRGKPGVQYLDRLSPFDYLLAAPDPTAQRLVSPRVRRFVEEDAASGGVYIETLLAYIAANLNAKAAAEVLYVHSNTVYYRIERIAERTGEDIRNFLSVLDLLVAVKLLTPKMLAQTPLCGPAVSSSVSPQEVRRDE
ncbi:helix-turn-helix domain-containing protein [Hoyosella sp. YIM 151337]|uniref:PucR family transcriptional regulator n=1 Tax=Hoyosella sp. YIM 151337 TaxID=2992742 RepID=UPI0022361751|nr:helix-turn-helix domain-containing protein [Hoyosella sp. YIM 151337]MCW4354524.1 helix-turn-helix domain-containing protein [Hoyosella sp. YIM 151337]